MAAVLYKGGGFKMWLVETQLVVMGKCPETTAHVFAMELLGQL